PTLNKIQAAQNQLAKTEQEKEGLEQNLTKLNAIDTAALQAQEDSLALQLPEQGMVRELLTGLESLAAGMGVSLSNIGASEPYELVPYLAMDFTLKFTGSYSAVFSYIQALEEGERLLSLQAFSIKEDKDKGVQCALQFTVYAEDFNRLTLFEAPGKDNPFID
ncbi:MAG TPA: hypothetical protein DEA85_01095, partial [Firmicutes bacterium]|nr:hypothetical protein [Bacillota bacterium]